jgi:hypothetical protein
VLIIVPESWVCRRPFTYRKKVMQLPHMSALNPSKKKLKITSEYRII